MNKVVNVVWYGNLKNLQKYQFFPFESKTMQLSTIVALFCKLYSVVHTDNI